MLFVAGRDFCQPLFKEKYIMKHLSKYEQELVALKLREATSLYDFVDVLNQVQNFILPKTDSNVKAITIQVINYLLYAKNGKAYKYSEIPKKSGGVRKIIAPNKRLRYIQRLINQCLHALYYPMPQAHGFVPERSIVSNARLHTNKKYVYNLDLSDFFPSISFHRLKAVLCKVKQIGINQKVAHIVANLCCHEGVLPQGAPTSPTLSNFVCIALDKKMYYLSKEGDFTYSRYADDITFSSNNDISKVEFKSLVAGIIVDEGFQLNKKKERLQMNNVIKSGKLYRQHQEVTGIVVNEKVNVNKKYIRNLEATLFNWETYGYDIASLLHEHFYKFSKGSDRYDGAIPAIEDVIMGRIEYLSMVRGKDDSKYQLFKIRYNTLCMKEAYTEKEMLNVLDVWNKDGLNAAMKKFYDKRNLLNLKTN